ncbi:AraC family transcriptional regulator [Sphingobium sufflavum]|uniref:AraC family transcriptional regulator n=1 Tax=Sphingobium sufflavum TaxID=1129547 RepID=UPI001F17D2F8|nr:AraC family transcriptional regulator [Sphingobium sufflavum]MCE7795430.1 AraC family transcriptional regulator [Sphingobium sufflavum]
MDWSLSEFLSLLELRGQTWCIVELCGSAGFSIPPHDGVSFYAIMQGSARIAGISGGPVELVPGEIKMVLSGEAHALRARPDSPTQSLDFLREEQNVDTPPVFRLGQGAVVARILCGRLRVTWPAGLRRMSMPPIIDMAAGPTAQGATAMRVETLHIFASGSGAAALLTRYAAMTLALALRNHPQCPLLFRLSASSDPIAHSLQLVAADPAADWSVASLAQKVGMSRSNFAARFALEVGRTPMEVITERRMLFAAELLETGELKIVEVSARAGYRSEAAFSRRFTRYFGLSPSQVRRKSQRPDRMADGPSLWQPGEAVREPPRREGVMTAD